jgi:hypothetical protein
MKVTKETTVELTPNELEAIIIEHFKSKGIDLKSCYFNVNGYNREDDFFAQYPLEYRLDKVICTSVTE